MEPEILAHLSIIGLAIFVGLYIYASTLYDGGSKVYPDKKTWDWVHNYWCDLIWPTTILGDPNRASRWGIAANFLLCLSTLAFFYAFSSKLAPPTFPWNYIIATFGTIAMICGMLIFSKWHDKVIALISLSGIPAVVGVVYGLIYFDRQNALLFGTIALALILINVYIFYTKKGERHLPFIQKIGFIAVIGWILFMNVLMLE